MFVGEKKGSAVNTKWQHEYGKAIAKQGNGSIHFASRLIVSLWDFNDELFFCTKHNFCSLMLARKYPSDFLVFPPRERESENPYQSMLSLSQPFLGFSGAFLSRDSLAKHPRLMILAKIYELFLRFCRFSLSLCFLFLYHNNNMIFCAFFGREKCTPHTEKVSQVSGVSKENAAERKTFSCSVPARVIE